MLGGRPAMRFAQAHKTTSYLTIATALLAMASGGGLGPMVTLLAHRFSVRREVPTRAAAWYIKEIPTFADALALVRSRLWHHAHFSLSQKNSDLVQIPRPLFDCLTETLCYAA